MSKILIVEDEESIADLEKDYLELSGFEVEIENQGDTGLVRAVKEDFDLLILDLMLPEVDGFEICREVREKKDIPIIMVSAKKDDIDKIRGLGLGADDYMTKPFSPSELVARVKAHLARYDRLVGNGKKENDVVEIRGIKIDKTARRVWVNGEEKQFTTKEFDLLTFLAENPNRVFTKEELFREIWDMESIGDIATVTVHIKKIREKIEFNTAKRICVSGRDKMGKIYYLMGKSASGKDHIYENLIQETALDLKPFVLYTTRPIRSGEQDGREYFFVDEKRLSELREAGKIIEERMYSTVQGPWYYFTADDGQIDLAKHDYLGIGTLESYLKLKAYFGEQAMVPLYVEVDDGLRLSRALERERKQTEPKYAEMCRRFLADCEDFTEEKIAEAGIVRRFSNNSTPEDCFSEIQNFVEQQKKL